MCTFHRRFLPLTTPMLTKIYIFFLLPSPWQEPRKYQNRRPFSTRNEYKLGGKKWSMSLQISLCSSLLWAPSENLIIHICYIFGKSKNLPLLKENRGECINVLYAINNRISWDRSIPLLIYHSMIHILRKAIFLDHSEWRWNESRPLSCFDWKEKRKAMKREIFFFTHTIVFCFIVKRKDESLTQLLSGCHVMVM